MPRACVSLLFAVLALDVGACASYDSRWHAAAAAKQEDPYAGAWTGRWVSKKHRGEGDKLRCILTPETDEAASDGEKVYRADFEAHWLKVFSSTHSVMLHVQPLKKPEGESAGVSGLAFAGTSALNTIVGKGTYHCEGMMTPTKMGAHYDATYDTGLFELGRP